MPPRRTSSCAGGRRRRLRDRRGRPVWRAGVWGRVVGLPRARRVSLLLTVAKRTGAAVTATASPTGGALVFVSYSREDVEWRRRFEEMLKPLVRERRLE